MTHVYFNESLLLLHSVHKAKARSEKKNHVHTDRVKNVINLINLLIQGKHYQASAILNAPYLLNECYVHLCRDKKMPTEIL
jgi:hypothetical protein